MLLSGTFTACHVSETSTRLEELQRQGYIVELDLSQLRLVGRDGIAMLMRASGMGTRLNYAPRYILEWITQEALQNNRGGH
jgi:hypothetical protein